MTRAQAIALFTGVGVMTVGGLTYRVFVPNPDTTRADVVDAGIPQACSPEVLECQVHVKAACRVRADGGLWPAYGSVRTKVLVCDFGQENPALVFRWPRVGGADCFDLAGPSDQACTVTDLCGDGGSDCAEDPSGTQPVTPVQSNCACRQPDAGACRVANPDGGSPILAALGNTLQPGTFAGAGCRRKPCFELLGVDPGGSWPDECPP